MSIALERFNPLVTGKVRVVQEATNLPPRESETGRGIAASASPGDATSQGSEALDERKDVEKEEAGEEEESWSFFLRNRQVPSRMTGRAVTEHMTQAHRPIDNLLATTQIPDSLHYISDWNH